MPIRRSISAYRAATPFEQAGWTLAFVVTAIVVPALLRWMLGSIAAAGAGQAGIPAEASRMAVDATRLLVQWAGVGVLAGLAVLCGSLAVSYLRGNGERTGIPRWAVAETYAIGAVAALAGALWLS